MLLETEALLKPNNTQIRPFGNAIPAYLRDSFGARVNPHGQL